MSNEELLELADKGFITKVGEYEAASAAVSTYTVESAANKKDFVDATSYAEVKEQIDVDFTITASSSPAEGGNVKINKGAQGLNVSATVDKGSKVTVTAIPMEATHNFDGWYVGESKTSSANPYSFKATENVTLVAKFTAK